jgi:hypothetical protein
VAYLRRIPFIDRQFRSSCNPQDYVLYFPIILLLLTLLLTTQGPRAGCRRCHQEEPPGRALRPESARPADLGRLRSSGHAEGGRFQEVSRPLLPLGTWGVADNGRGRRAPRS